jgi:hypothetical protein
MKATVRHRPRAIPSRPNRKSRHVGGPFPVPDPAKGPEHFPATRATAMFNARRDDRLKVAA